MRGFLKFVGAKLKAITAPYEVDALRQNTPPDERDVDAAETRAALEASSGQHEEVHAWHLARN